MQPSLFDVPPRVFTISAVNTYIRQKLEALGVLARLTPGEFLSVGIEHVEDILADIGQALEQIR